MKNTGLIIIISIVGIFLSACSSTQEASTETRSPKLVQQQQWQEQQENRQEQGERSGLTQEEIQKMNSYAERKAEMQCQMAALEKSSEQALSESAASEIKKSIVKLDQKATELNKEIDEYCNTEPRKKYFHQIYKQYAHDCE